MVVTKKTSPSNEIELTTKFHQIRLDLLDRLKEKGQEWPAQTMSDEEIIAFALSLLSLFEGQPISEAKRVLFQAVSLMDAMHFVHIDMAANVSRS